MNTLKKNTFLQLAKLAQRIHQTHDINRKIQLCTSYLSNINYEQDILLATQYLVEGAFASVSGRRISIGHRAFSMLVSNFCEIDYELVFKPCKVATGSSSETIQRLMENLPAANVKFERTQLSLQDVHFVYEHLHSLKKRDEKYALLLNTWTKMSPLEVTYFIQLLNQRPICVDMDQKILITAISKAFNKTLEEIQHTYMSTGSIGETSLLAKKDILSTSSYGFTHPIPFMKASTIEIQTIERWTNYVAEEKLDGMRCQVLISENKTTLFSNELTDITHFFPEITTFFGKKSLPNLVLEGQLCVFKDNTIMPFQLLQERLATKHPSQQLIKEFPVLFISYDVLYANETITNNMTLEKRRKILELLSANFTLPIISQTQPKSLAQMEELHEKALAHGNQGLILKEKGSLYKYGKQGDAWLKIEPPKHSIYTVLLYAHSKSGDRQGVYRDFTLGISVKDDARFAEEYIPIGRTNEGYTNEELMQLNSNIRLLISERFGSTILLKPEIIVELEFENIEVNTRKKAKYLLRRPQFKSLFWGHSPSTVNTLKDVEQTYHKRLTKKRLNQNSHSSFYISNTI